MDETNVFRILKEMEQDDLEQREKGIERDKRWRSIPEVSGKFLYQMVMMHQPQTIVEIGMSHGYSTIWMGLASITYGGQIYSYEIEEWRYDQAVQNITKAGLDTTITPNLVDEAFNDYPENIDLVFIDAEKSDYIDHYDKMNDKLADNAIILADNVLSHEEDLQYYRDHMRLDQSIFTITIPIGKGIEVSRRKLHTEMNWTLYNR